MTARTGSLPFIDTLGGAAALVDARRETCLGRAGLEAGVRDAAAGLAARGAGRGARVVLCDADPVRLVLALFGCWAVGATAVVVPPGLTPGERRVVQDRADAVAWAGEGPDLGRSGSASPSPLGLDETAVILMTSGTTGAPKGVALTLRSLIARSALNVAHIGAQDLAETLCILPLHFGHGLIGNLLTPLAASGRVHLWPAPAPAELGAVAGHIVSARIRFMSSVPSHWRMLTRLPPPRPASLARVHVGSAPLSRELWEEIADWTGTRQVWNMFGMTECANWFSGAVLDPDAEDGAIGRPWGGAAAVRDEHGEVAATGSGELLIQSPSMMSGYFDDPDRTSAAFLGGWLRTGDVAEIGRDGSIRLRGRIKEEINRAGIKIHPEEVEMVLERHPDIAEACAFAVPDPVGGEIVGAAVVLRDGASAATGDILAWIRGQIRGEAVPVRLWTLPALPRSDRGKLLREKVRDAAAGTAP